MIENVNQDTGFGERSTDMGGRMVNKDGSYNIRRIGIHVHHRMSNYQNMLTMPRWQFLIVIFLVYLLINCVFTALYWFSGPTGLEGIQHQDDALGQPATRVVLFLYTDINYGGVWTHKSGQ